MGYNQSWYTSIRLHFDERQRPSSISTTYRLFGTDAELCLAQFVSQPFPTEGIFAEMPSVGLQTFELSTALTYFAIGAHGKYLPALNSRRSYGGRDKIVEKRYYHSIARPSYEKNPPDCCG